MKLKIQKWGNCAAVKLPTTLLSKISATIGDTLEIDPQDFRVVKRKYKFDDLLNQCNKKAKPSTDMAKWDTGQVGQEIINLMARVGVMPLSCPSLNCPPHN